MLLHLLHTFSVLHLYCFRIRLLLSLHYFSMIALTVIGYYFFLIFNDFTWSSRSSPRLWNLLCLIAFYSSIQHFQPCCCSPFSHRHGLLVLEDCWSCLYEQWDWFYIYLFLAFVRPFLCPFPSTFVVLFLIVSFVVCLFGISSTTCLWTFEGANHESIN